MQNNTAPLRRAFEVVAVHVNGRPLVLAKIELKKPNIKQEVKSHALQN